MKVNYSREGVEMKLSHKEYAALGIALNTGIRHVDKDDEYLKIAKILDEQMRKPNYIL